MGEVGYSESFHIKSPSFRKDSLGSVIQEQITLNGSTGLFKLGNWRAGRMECEMGREAQTAQMDTVKAAYNGESSNNFWVKIQILVTIPSLLAWDSRE